MPTDLEQERELLRAERDAEICGIGYLVDGVRVSPERVRVFYRDRAALAAPAAPQEQPSDERLTASEQRMLHDFPHLMDFYQKHALGPMRAPSCLRCGKSMQGEKPALKHLELPGIVICADCMAPSAAPQAGEDAKPVDIDPAFIADLDRSRTKYPGIARMFDGLMGEVDELRRAYNGDGDIRAEAFDVAVCAYRIATEGDDGGNTMLEQPAAQAAPAVLESRNE